MARFDNLRKQFPLYLASALGTMFLSMGDLLNNDSAAMVLKIGETINKHFFAIGSAGLVATGAVTMAGGVLCWIRQPTTRLEAFATGFSVFGVLAAATPYAPPGGLSASVVNTGSSVNPPSTAAGALLVTPVFAAAPQPIVPPAQDDTQRRSLVSKALSRGVGTAELRILGLTDGVVTVTLRDPDTKEILGRERTRDGVVTIRRPAGIYEVTIEVDNYRRGSVRVEVPSTGRKSYTTSLAPTWVPVPLQRLVSPKELDIREVAQ